MLKYTNFRILTEWSPPFHFTKDARSPELLPCNYYNILNMRRLPILFTSIALALLSCTGEESLDSIARRVYSVADIQMRDIDNRLAPDSYPKTYENGVPKDSDQGWWCSGFYPGTLWLLYEQTGDESYRSLAEKHTLKLSDLPDMITDHDIGFQIASSFGNAYRITADTCWLGTLKKGALCLAGRFSPVTGTTKSWNFSRNWDFPVIIDNMMNLETLTMASRLFQLDSLAEIACTHANTTIKNHFMDDFSCFHLVDYDSTDGHIRGKQTVQGYSDDSAWARGQAWALYGYTMMARETAVEQYLHQAEGIADMLLGRLPEDGIPYWDFDDPAIPDALRDASAGAIMSSAFAELAGMTASSTRSKAYRQMAERQLRTLASEEYLASPGTNGGFLLKHSVGNIPGGTEIDVPLSYADYYFIEALGRLIE